MKQIIVQVDQETTKVAMMEDQQLIEYTVGQPSDNQVVGNIYKGRVVNVLPGMQALFVDIGQGKNAFLYIDDILPAHLEKQPKQKPSISELMHEGQELMVQVMKEPVGTKGARVTTHFSIPGRWIVYMPHSDYVGVSRKIESEAERNRLKTIGEELREAGEGLIIRTVANGESKLALEMDLAKLRKLWRGIMRKQRLQDAPSLLFRDLDMELRFIRDVFTEETDRLIINDANKAAEIKRFVSEIAPELVDRIELFEQGVPIHQYYEIDQKLDLAFESKVWLNNGGYVNIDHTEALTVIDVNTGKYTGTDDLEQTVFETNLEAAEKIAWLLRLRDIGGMIIVDFIDMNEAEHHDRIVERLEQLMKKDRTKSLVVGWTRLGLLEITRKKVRENIEDWFSEPCPHCGGKGRIHKGSVNNFV